MPRALWVVGVKHQIRHSSPPIISIFAEPATQGSIHPGTQSRSRPPLLELPCGASFSEEIVHQSCHGSNSYSSDQHCCASHIARKPNRQLGMGHLAASSKNSSVKCQCTLRDRAIGYNTVDRCLEIKISINKMTKLQNTLSRHRRQMSQLWDTPRPVPGMKTRSQVCPVSQVCPGCK